MDACECYIILSRNDATVILTFKNIKDSHKMTSGDKV